MLTKPEQIESKHLPFYQIRCPAMKKDQLPNYTSSSYNSIPEIQPNQNVGKSPKQTFLQRHIQMANKHVKRCSTSLVIRGMKIKTAMRYITSHKSEWSSSKCLQTINAGEGVEKRELLHCWWDCKLIQPLWKMVWRFL